MANVTDKLLQLMADSHVMFTKLHNYHWNVRGLQFYTLHAKTEEAYAFFATAYDDLAERILQLGGTPLVTLKDIIARTSIKEETKTRFDAEYVVKSILEDYQYFLNEFRALSEAAEGDPTTQAYADDKVAHFEKEVWMLQSNLA